MLNTLVLLPAAALCTAGANLFFRVAMLRMRSVPISIWQAGQLLREPLLSGGVLMHVIAIILWLRVLSITNISSSYPAFIGLTFVFVTLGAVRLCGERITWYKALGLAMIVFGIVLVTL